MKIKDIIGKGRERRFRGPRKPRLKQVGFHKKMKNLLDAESVSYTHLTLPTNDQV